MGVVWVHHCGNGKMMIRGLWNSRFGAPNSKCWTGNPIYTSSASFEGLYLPKLEHHNAFQVLQMGVFWVRHGGNDADDGADADAVVGQQEGFGC